ncbi:hypothetical protein [Limnobacter sp.]|uniref:hypothetical protein n=1 Tax=Limnobacter sp. TaxID=2003368 RepID=UPI002EDB328A
MPLLEQFSTPANVQDFPDNPTLQQAMNAAWNGNVNRWVNAALLGDVWDLVNYGPRPAFYNPLTLDTPTSAVSVGIPWSAFPGRISALFPNDSGSWFQWADQGVPKPVTTDLCSGNTIAPIPYPPTGPRGWQDEYCEWSVRRNELGKITQVMFTCENPEYWFTLWQVSPAQVLSLYQQLVSPNVQLQDLCLPGVTDPVTGQPAYNPLNKWNAGTVSTDTAGGAVHLTSSPNTLGAEYDLAAAATMPRSVNGEPVKSAAQLVCCARYGKIGRHSDPTIGQSVNQYVNYNPKLTEVRATLTNPPGLYMQSPDFSAYKTPDGTPASKFWTVVRGRLANPTVSGDIDRILHATFSVPSELGYTVSDITINGKPILWASQIANTFDMALMATVFGNSGVSQTPVSCTVASTNPSPSVSALQDAPTFAAYRALEQNMNELPLSVPILAFPVTPGSTRNNVALLLNTGDAPDGAVFTVPEGDVKIAITGTQDVAGMTVYLVSITTAPNAVLGDRTILAQVPGMASTQQAAIGLLTVVSSLGSGLNNQQRLKPSVLKGRA